MKLTFLLRGKSSRSVPKGVEVVNGDVRDELVVRVSHVPARERPQAQPLASDILFEDDDLLAVNKPPP